MQYCRIISMGNNNSVKFTSSREDNSTTNDSMVMKIAHAQLHMYTNIIITNDNMVTEIAHAQLHMYTNIMYKIQSSTCKTVGEKLRTNSCPRTDGWTD